MTYDEVLASLDDVEAEYAYRLTGEAFWSWWERKQAEEVKA